MQRRLDAADAAVHGDHEANAISVQTVERRRLQAIPIAQPFRNEMRDVRAQQLERAPEDDGRGDAVDVVVAVYGDPLAPLDGAEDAIDGRPHVGERVRVVQIVERG